MKEMGVKHENIKQGTPGEAAANKPEYPHIMLSEKHLDKLGIKEMPPVGAAMHMKGHLHVVGAMMNDGPHGKSRMLHLQVTHMELNKGGEHSETDGDEKGKKLYGESKEK